MRSRLLNLIFELLYRHFVLFHEAGGIIVFGDAWKSRRTSLLNDLGGWERAIDLGAGEGRLVQAAARKSIEVAGYDPSLQMRRAARRRGTIVMPGSSFSLPIADGSVDAVLASYPGKWILDPLTWRELDRVLVRDGRILAVVGGTYEHGQLAWLRRLIARAVYGKAEHVELRVPAAEVMGFDVEIQTVPDEWGAVIQLRAVRRYR